MYQEWNLASARCQLVELLWIWSEFLCRRRPSQLLKNQMHCFLEPLEGLSSLLSHYCCWLSIFFGNYSFSYFSCWYNLRYKWDNNEKHLRPETGLLQIRAALKVFANLRPATVLPQVTILRNFFVSLCETLIFLFLYS